MGNSRFNGLFARPGRVLLVEDDVKPRATLPNDALCNVCGDECTILEVTNGSCFSCRYRAEFNRRTK